MSRVLTFSRVYPSYHPRKGEQTFFREKIWCGLADLDKSMDVATSFKIPDEIIDWDWYEYYNGVPKWHTVRAGNRWKVGDKFSPRVWSGKPYASKQIIIAPDIEVKRVWKFTCAGDYFYLNDKQIDVTSCDIPKNDGLETEDFLNWFPNNRMFTGQAICWNENIDY